MLTTSFNIPINTPPMSNKFLLEWHLSAGVDEVIGDEPINYFASSGSRGKGLEVREQKVAIREAKIPDQTSTLHYSPIAASAAARELANSCSTLADLEVALLAFNGCALKKTATKTVFADGNPQAKIMIIGEAPEAQEDVQGVPFCGANGELLDKMLAAIGLNRKAEAAQESVYLSNPVFWRPPGNRQPSAEEIAVCLPFVEKHIALVAPKLLVLSGGTAARALLVNDQSISRLRGKWYEYNNEYLAAPIKTALMYHPSYLRNQPQFKKQAWQDLLMIKEFLAG